MTAAGKAVLITGCDSRIGYAIARQLDNLVSKKNPLSFQTHDYFTFLVNLRLEYIIDEIKTTLVSLGATLNKTLDHTRVYIHKLYIKISCNVSESNKLLQF